MLSIEGRAYGIRVWGPAPGAFTGLTSDLPGMRNREPDPLSPPDAIAPALLYMCSDLSGERTGIVLGVCQRGVREICMRSAKSSSPKGPWTAQHVADHAEDVFFAGNSVTAVE